MVGREKEKKELEKLYGSKQAELVAIYGRRRIGKTYLVKEYFRTMQRRIEMLRTKISPKMSIYSTLITTYGLKKNEYSSAFIKTVTFEDLFL